MDYGATFGKITSGLGRVAMKGAELGAYGLARGARAVTDEFWRETVGRGSPLGSLGNYLQRQLNENVTEKHQTSRQSVFNPHQLEGIRIKLSSIDEKMATNGNYLAQLLSIMQQQPNESSEQSASGSSLNSALGTIASVLGVGAIAALTAYMTSNKETTDKETAVPSDNETPVPPPNPEISVPKIPKDKVSEVPVKTDSEPRMQPVAFKIPEKSSGDELKFDTLEFIAKNITFSADKMKLGDQEVGSAVSSRGFTQSAGMQSVKAVQTAIPQNIPPQSIPHSMPTSPQFGAGAARNSGGGSSGGTPGGNLATLGALNPSALARSDSGTASETPSVPEVPSASAAPALSAPSAPEVPSASAAPALSAPSAPEVPSASTQSAPGATAMPAPQTATPASAPSAPEVPSASTQSAPGATAMPAPQTAAPSAPNIQPSSAPNATAMPAPQTAAPSVPEPSIPQTATPVAKPKTFSIKPGSTLDGYVNKKTGRIEVPFLANGMVPKNIPREPDGSIDPKKLTPEMIPPQYKDKVEEYGGKFSENTATPEIISKSTQYALNNEVPTTSAELYDQQATTPTNHENPNKTQVAENLPSQRETTTQDLMYSAGQSAEFAGGVTT